MQTESNLLGQEDLFNQEGSSSMPSARSNDELARLPRVSVDFTLPLWGLVGAAVFAGTGLITMYYQLANLSEKVTNLQVDVKASNASTIQFAQEQAIIKFRVEKLEAAEARAGDTRSSK